MIKVSVMYPADDGKRFDHDYYRTHHMPMIKARLGSACDHYTVDRGLIGREPDSSPTYVAMCHIYSASVDVFQEAFAPHAAEIVADVANYTDIVPIMQTSEVVVG